MMESKLVDIYNNVEFDALIKNIHVEANEKIFDSLIEEHRQETDKRKKIEKNKYVENLPMSLRWNMQDKVKLNPFHHKVVVLDINTSDTKRIKAYKLMNTFISYLSKFGGRLYVEKFENSDNTRFDLLESIYKCCLYEKHVKLRDKLIAEERKMKPLYNLEYTGDLCFEIYVKNKKQDKNNEWELIDIIEIEKSESIEEKLKCIFTKLREDAITRKVVIDEETAKLYAEREKEFKEWEEKEKQDEQAKIEKAKLQEKQQLQEIIRNQMIKWENIKKVIEYINELRSEAEVGESEKIIISKYCDYVEEIYCKSVFFKEIIEFMQKVIADLEEKQLDTYIKLIRE